MNKIALAVAVAASVTTFSAFASDARSTGVGGAKVASSDYRSSGYNPALASVHKSSDDFSFQLNGGIEASDQDQMLDGIDALQAAIDDLDQKINSGTALPGDEGEVLSKLADLDSRVVEIGIGGGLTVALPSDFIGGSLFLRTDSRFGVDFDYDSNDDNQIRINLINGDPVDTNLGSRIRGSGYGLTEAGVALATTFADVGPGDLSVGVSPKYLRVDLFDKNQKISEFETTTLDDSLTEESGFNADLGAFYAFGEAREYRVGASLKNIVPVDVEGSTGETFKLDPLATIAASYKNSWFMATAETDLTVTNGYGRIPDSQYFRTGLELNAVDWAQLRLGYRHDLKGNRDNVVTAGIGVSPFDVVNIDLSGIYGQNDTYGAVFQIGVGF